MSLPNVGFRLNTNRQGANSICPPRWNVTTMAWNSRGVFFGDDLFQEHFMIFAAQFILFSLANHVIYLVLRPLKQPKFVCSVLVGADGLSPWVGMFFGNERAGVLVGPNGMGQFFPRFKEAIYPSYEMMVMRTVAVVASTYFILIVAVKTDVTIIFRKFKHSVWIGIVTVALPFGTVLLLTSKIQVDGIKHSRYFYNLYASGLSVSRFATVAYSIDELNLSSSELGQLVMSASIPSELFTYMSLLVGIFTRQNSAKESMVAAGAITSMVLLMIFVLRPLLLSIIAKTPEGRPVKEVFVTGILLLAMFVTGISDMLGAVNFGVLVLGLIVPDGPPLGAAIVEKAELFIMEYLMPTFYMMVGYNLNIFVIRSQDLKAMIGIIATANVAKFVGAMVPALWCTPHERHAVVVGLMASFKGPFDLFLFNRWLRREELDKSAFAILVIIEVMTTAIVSPLVQKMHEKCMESENHAHRNLRAIHTTPKNEEFRMLYCIQSEEDVPAIISILELANASPSSRLCAYMINMQELVGRAVPVFISHNEHHRQLKSERYTHMSRAFENYLRSSNGHLVIKTFTMIAPFKNMHMDICRLARTELVPVIIMPFHRNSLNATTVDAANQVAAFRNINMNVQDNAPCTVGILVDKGIRRCMPNNKTEFSCEVAVLFLGGQDDREGLALGARMSGHPGVKLFVLRLALKRKVTELEDVMDQKADDAILDEFRHTTEHNDSVSYSEVVVGDVARIMNEVHSLGDRFDLIIVGRQRESTRTLFDSIFEWSENPELGGIGDMIASRDFRGTNTSLLVLQHYGINRGLSKHYTSEYEDNYLLDPSGRF